MMTTRYLFCMKQNKDLLLIVGILFLHHFPSFLSFVQYRTVMALGLSFCMQFQYNLQSTLKYITKYIMTVIYVFIDLFEILSDRLHKVNSSCYWHLSHVQSYFGLHPMTDHYANYPFSVIIIKESKYWIEPSDINIRHEMNSW